ncbi:cytosolic enolase 3 [Nicotiana sylvestris]|uniref:phosphopyruvate hydratase n=3 Tax=Nicotiana TaxID=4085 RepID=A0A1S4BGP5_TOBAC|nr:PREDICTED: cytosolic enolase 3 [Nicotiana sylvestris]XP_016488029.1 PREDICTED: cytosolic enolase 3-like isoform X1 [Nicotiana tabacum]
MSVQEYLDKHMLSRRIEDAVNAAVRAKTPDPVLFISNHMRKSVPSVITKVKARQILDSRGIPTVEVDLHTNKGVFRASVPSGASSGMYEAIELRDGEKGTYLGNSVNRAVKNINEKISVALVGMDPTLQSQIDQIMIDLDRTENKSELGANAILAVSIAACKAGATEKEVPLYKHIADLSGQTSLLLPIPVFTLVTGGKHAGNNLAIQEIMILPVGSKTFEEALQIGSETYHHLKVVITEKYGAYGCNVGEDGGFAPDISSLRDGLDLVQEAIGRTGYKEKIKIAIGVAATEFCIGTKYDLDFKTPNKSGQNFKSGQDMIDMYKELCADYPVVSIEDPFDKEDWEHVKYFSSLGMCQVVGDDLLMSNPKRIERAIQENACNALLLKVNQIGTVTEAIEVVKMAKDAQWGVVISQRSGETEESFIADLSVGLATGQIKAGAPCRGERLAKYNQLLRIEQELGDQAFYIGEKWRT